MEYQYKTPKEFALAYLRPYVERGDELDWLIRGQSGLACDEGWISIGGYCDRGGEKYNPLKLKSDELAVYHFHKSNEFEVFKLRKLYQELRSNQLQLF